MTIATSVPYRGFAQTVPWSYYQSSLHTTILPASHKSTQTPSLVIENYDGSATTRAPRQHIQLLKSLYSTDDSTTLVAFLEHHPFLVPVLIEAFFQIDTFFPSFTGFLDVHTDPDDSMDRQIVLSIMTSLSPEDALAKLDQFDEQWWLDELGKARGKLCIMLGFQ